jgi:anionic cell wall polymer biosynthesis LytR-Cps2A-Psr (LCP) family protein
MSTIVGVTDRAGFEANTDNLVLAEPRARRLLWIPRDLWCPKLGDRINVAYRAAGHEGLRAALAEHGLEAEHSLVVTREATEAALADVSVTVPVPARMTFEYPLSPTARIEDGRKTITFEPPAERLSGERIHQWLGARAGSDLHRITRQQFFLRRLLETGFSFDRLLAYPERVRCSDPLALEDLAEVDGGWALETLDGLEPTERASRMVLVRR